MDSPTDHPEPAPRPRPEVWPYEMQLVADRVVASGSLDATFALELTAEDVAFLNDSGGTEFLTIPIRPQAAPGG